MTDNLDPLRKIEGFPLGKDEDLHALSNPPYYTAYPNPHIAGFIEQYGKPYDETTDDYHREPYVDDVEAGKDDQVYQAHAYHTKVPYKAISAFIEHYTEPGDIIFDGFSGSGMTGIAAQTSGRNAILSDLAPAATFISSSYNHTVKDMDFLAAAKQLLKDLRKECSWMYETTDSIGKPGIINFTVWSDVHSCPYCQKESILWDIAVDTSTKIVRDEFTCPNCRAELNKATMPKAYNSDGSAKTIPVWIDYSVGKRRLEKKPDLLDLELLHKINLSEIPYWYPTDKMMFIGERWGDMFVPLHHDGISQVNQFYTKRNLWSLAILYHLIFKLAGKNTDLRNALLMLFTSVSSGLTSKMTRYNFGKRGNGYLSGTLYIPSYVAETRVDKVLENKVDDLLYIHKRSERQKVYVTTQSSTDLPNVPANSIDYIFIDPPFGRNLMYSELNFLWEAWLKVFTNNKMEAIVNKSQHKNREQYRHLMYRCFSEMYRILKPNRWITVEFHNSQASIWNAIQEALSRSGFVVAQVIALDKKQGSYKQVVEVGAVKNDLVINAYKPRAGFTQRLISQAGHGLEVDFVREHLRQLPIAANVERSKEMLYSKYLAYYVQHGYQVAYNGEQFYRALSQWGLEERDGYWFLDESQAQDYEHRKVKTFGKKGVQPQAVLFMSDERSARHWVWNFLDEPKTYDEIYTKFIPALQTSEDAIPELKTLLEESFVRKNGHWKRPDQLTQAELEQKRLERLLRQFNEYLEAAQAGQKVKEVRREAVLAGFTECYRKGRFQDILTLGRKLDKRLLEESPDLFDFIDIAEAKIES